MRILNIIHTHWSRNLGAPRVQLELSEELRKLGHTVEKFSYEDAFPYQQSIIEQLTCNFSLHAKAFVQKNAHRFDIIEANQTDLPFTKKELGFGGLLVARSVGLIPMYKEVLDSTKFKQSEKVNLKSLAKRMKSNVRYMIGYQSQKRRERDAWRSLQLADLITVPNRDELAYVRDVMGLGSKCICIPFGLSQQRYESLSQAILPTSLRLKKQQVAFIGSWGERKGSKDWQEIILRTKTQVPSVNFLFLGTGFSREIILEELNFSECEWIEVVPSFNSEELPELLGGAMVGAFPSYIEGFGFAVLEKLACGLPTVAYDIPGPREMLDRLNYDLMVPCGDAKHFSQKLVDLLTLNESDYYKISKESLSASQQFSWAKIAQETIEIYSEWLEPVKRDN